MNVLSIGQKPFLEEHLSVLPRVRRAVPSTPPQPGYFHLCSRISTSRTLWAILRPLQNPSSLWGGGVDLWWVWDEAVGHVGITSSLSPFCWKLAISLILWGLQSRILLPAVVRPVCFKLYPHIWFTEQGILRRMVKSNVTCGKTLKKPRHKVADLHGFP